VLDDFWKEQFHYLKFILKIRFQFSTENTRSGALYESIINMTREQSDRSATSFLISMTRFACLTVVTVR
jgi:hypothetical protein